MPHRRSCRNRDITRPAQPLRVEGLERRSMMAADVSYLDVSYLVDFADIGATMTDDDVDRSIAIWPDVVIDPFTEPGDGIAICPLAQEERIAVIPGSFDDACDLSDPWDEDPQAGESSDAAVNPAHVEDSDVPETRFDESGNLLLCPTVTNPPTPIALDPTQIEPWSDPVLNIAIDSTGAGDLNATHVAIEDLEIAPRPWAITDADTPKRIPMNCGFWWGAPDCWGKPGWWKCGTGGFGAHLPAPIAVGDVDPTSEPAAESPVAVEDAVTDQDETTASPAEAIPPADELIVFGDEEPMALAFAEMSKSASRASAPAISAATDGTTDAARLFAAYASSLGQGAAEGLSTTGVGGRRSARRAN